jgi:hypothetical protein
MLKILQYKLFVNSTDFATIFNQSKNELKKNGDLESYYCSLIKPALEKNHTFLLYKDEKVIGYEICFLEKKIINGGFTFILPEYRKNGYSYLLRERMWSLVEKECDGEIKCFILNSNKSSLESAQKTAKKMDFEMILDKEVLRNNVCVGKIWKLKKKIVGQ